MKRLQMNKIALITSGVLLMLSGQAVFAQAQQSYSMETRALSGKLTQSGTPSGNLPLLKGFAKDLPLITVMRQVTPSGWKVKKDDSSENPLNVNTMISWQGGKNWVDTLESIAVENDLNIKLDWDSKELVLSPLSREAKLARLKRHQMMVEERLSQERKETIPVFEGNAPQESKIILQDIPPSVASFQMEEVTPAKINSVVAAQPMEADVPALPRWEKVSGLSLRENIEKWALKVGYKVVWLGEDYPIDDSTSYVGNFESDTGPIRQLADDYGPKSRVQQPLSFQFYQNQTLVVENWKFEQGGFPQYVHGDK